MASGLAGSSQCPDAIVTWAVRSLGLVLTADCKLLFTLQNPAQTSFPPGGPPEIGMIYCRQGWCGAHRKCLLFGSSWTLKGPSSKWEVGWGDICYYPTTPNWAAVLFGPV